MTSQVFKFHLELYVTLLTVVLILLRFMRLAKAIALLPPLVGSSLGLWKPVCASIVQCLPVQFVDMHTNLYIFIYIK